METTYIQSTSPNSQRTKVLYENAQSNQIHAHIVQENVNIIIQADYSNLGKAKCNTNVCSPM